MAKRLRQRDALLCSALLCSALQQGIIPDENQPICCAAPCFAQSVSAAYKKHQGGKRHAATHVSYRPRQAGATAPCVRDGCT